MHDKRSGGDLSHVDLGSTALNEHLFGEEGWKKTLLAEIDQAKRQNIHAHVEALKAKSRKREARGVQEQGLVDPWKRSRHGPLREGILTVNKKWFGGTGHADWDPEQVGRFRAAALAFLQQHFPDGQLRYASGHADEEAYHIHFVVAVWRERITVNRGQQVLLQASMNPLIYSYEHAQDLAGEAFTDLGITRGVRDAEARREAKRNGEPVPAKRRHVPPSQWRAEQQKLARAEAQQTLEDEKQKADRIVEEGRTLASATVRKSRKRAIKEARERKDSGQG
ncbi:plasmid recombination protein [Roseovarius sp. M141]|uniref:plasmid recombination protein n=1 Tax=Roseovarius sp. M141 TaxID=2583806 RepID=UPI0020CC2327|nr:plasmid recombination protein [Roseovarius sp. M141]